jgi:transposase-like protein
MYQSGKPVKEIAEAFGVSLIWVWKVVQRAGLTNRREKMKARTVKTIKEIKELRQKGMDFQTIAEKYNLSIATVMWYCYRK